LYIPSVANFTSSIKLSKEDAKGDHRGIIGRLRGDRGETTRRPRGDYGETAGRPRGDDGEIAGRSRGDCRETAGRPRGDYRETTGRSRGDCAEVAGKLRRDTGEITRRRRGEGGGGREKTEKTQSAKRLGSRDRRRREAAESDASFAHGPEWLPTKFPEGRTGGDEEETEVRSEGVCSPGRGGFEAKWIQKGLEPTQFA